MRTIIALVLREMGATYGQSPGGYVWAVVQPIGIICILSVGFSLLVRSPSLGTSFLLFYATGFLPFDMYNILTQKISGALTYSRPLLAYPRVTWLDAILGRFVLNVLTLLTVSSIVFTAIMIFVESRTVLDVRYIALGFALAAAAELEVDTTPMEGFDAAQFDDILGLTDKGLKSVVLLAVGTRDASGDWLAPLKKVRKPAYDLVTDLN